MKSFLRYSMAGELLYGMENSFMSNHHRVKTVSREQTCLLTIQYRFPQPQGHYALHKLQIFPFCMRVCTGIVDLSYQYLYLFKHSIYSLIIYFNINYFFFLNVGKINKTFTFVIFTAHAQFKVFTLEVLLKMSSVPPPSLQRHSEANDRKYLYTRILGQAVKN